MESSRRVFFIARFETAAMRRPFRPWRAPLRASCNGSGVVVTAEAGEPEAVRFR